MTIIKKIIFLKVELKTFCLETFLKFVSTVILPPWFPVGGATLGQSAQPTGGRLMVYIPSLFLL